MKCYKCKKEKSLDEFVKDKSRRNGRNNKCKECQKKYWRSWFGRNPDAYKAKSRKPGYWKSWAQNKK